MKNYLFIILALTVFVKTNAQVTAKDCSVAVNVCTSNSFSVSPAGPGFTDFTTSSTISNPTGNPPGVVPVGGAGCLKAGELNPTWMIINIQTPGTLEFSMGAGTGPGAQSGCYDWIMWPYSPTSCSGINGNTLAPIRCCWNSFCSGGTGLASAANLPAGGHSQDFGAPINCNCGDKFIMCFSDYSSVTTLVPLNFFGTAIVSCSPISSTLSISSASICPGGIATLSVSSSPGTTYTWQPGGQTTPSISVSPSSTTNYTLLATNACGTFSGTTSVFVSPSMNITFSNTNGSCVPAAYGSSTVNVTGGSGPYSYSWSPVGGTSPSTSGLTTGNYSMTVTDALGCKSTATTNIIAPAPFTLSLSVSTPSLLTCTNSVVTLAASSSSTLSNVTYTWTAPSSATATGSSFNATQAGVYTVVGGDQTVGSCTDTQTIAITQNTTAPSVTVNPISQTITCNGGCKTFTAITTSTTNLVGTWFDPSGTPVVGPSGTPLLLCANAPGTYTATYVNVITGCTTSQTVAVSANITVPTITITPVTSNGFTINCTHPNVQMNINSSGTLAPTGYTWTNLSTSVSTSPPSGGYTVTVPGQYEAAFHDGNNCTVTTTVTIYIDTLRPSPMSMTNLPSNSYTLNCYTPTLTATALTNPLLPPTSYSWTTPPNLIVSSNTIGISLINITSSTTPTSYTVLAMGANGCVGKAKINFYKDIYVPPYSVVFTPTAITCSNPCIALTGVSSATTPVSYTFTSPPPTQTATTAGALMCSSGTYTMTYMNVLNGCTGTATNAVALNVTPPGTVALSPITLPCGQTTTIISAGTTTTSPTYSYTWAGPPLSGMSCPGGVGCNTTQVNAPGIYFVTILNTANGCRSTNEVIVNSGTVNASFNTDPTSGYAPLEVNFDNTSNLGSLTSGTVTTIWNYGNGITYTVSGSSASYSAAGYPDGNAMYQATGSYTVWMIITQNTGTASCVGTASAVVNVDLPSDLTVPNVFTPNGDGVNDNFTLLTTNLTNITCVIFDRWGVKMYDVTADKGNISWDGKNFSNKDVPAGTYFYILKATGKDFKEFEQKGTISLFR